MQEKLLDDLTLYEEVLIYMGNNLKVGVISKINKTSIRVKLDAGGYVTVYPHKTKVKGAGVIKEYVIKENINVPVLEEFKGIRK